MPCRSLATRDDYTRWVERLLSVPLSAKTVRNHHSLVSDAMRSAVRAGLVTNNHAEGIRIETPDADDLDEMVTLTDAEVVAFVTATPEHWRPMVVFMFGTGVRWQEAAALKVGDVDLDRQQARIQRAWKDTGEQGTSSANPSPRGPAERSCSSMAPLRRSGPWSTGANLTRSCSPTPAAGRCGTPTSPSRRGHRAAHVIAGDIPRPW